MTTSARTTALAEVGCPPGIAQELSRRGRVDRPWGSTGRLLVLDGHGCGFPTDRDDIPDAVRHLAANASADNAEAVDRAARQEPGGTPYWPLPDRSPRRQGRRSRPGY